MLGRRKILLLFSTIEPRALCLSVRCLLYIPTEMSLHLCCIQVVCLSFCHGNSAFFRTLCMENVSTNNLPTRTLTGRVLNCATGFMDCSKFNQPLISHGPCTFCNVYVIQQDTQYLMIKFIHNIQQLNMFRTSIVHLQERPYAVRCNLVCLCCYDIKTILYVITTGHIETYQITTYSIMTLLKIYY